MWFFSYLIFRFKASNLHGIQSPFVYELVKHCIFNSRWENQKKLIFKPLGIKSLTEIFYKNLQEFLKINSPKIKQEVFSFSKNQEIIFLENILVTHKTTDEILFFIKNIYLNRSLWSHEVQTKKLIIIDFFFWGILIKRKQKSQLFMIKVF